MIPSLSVRLGILATLSTLPSFATVETDALPTRLRVQIDLNSRLRDIQLMQAGLDLFAPKPDGTVEAFVTPAEHDYLTENLGYDVQVLSWDIHKEFAARHGFLGNGNLRDYRNYDENVSFLFDVESDHPAIAKVELLGNSLQGRSTYALKISDNVGQNEDEPEVLYTAIHHSREPVSNETVLQLIDLFTDSYGSDPEITDLVKNRELWFVPLVNPDGYAYVDEVDPYWRKNRRGNYGVDLNRNYGFKWGFDDIGSSPSPSSEIYRGSGAFSEPETQNIRDLCNAHEFVFAMNFHTFGEYYLWPWGYIPSPTEDQNLFSAFGDSLSRDNGYTSGIGSQVLYITNGDADDWMYGETASKPAIFAITPEIGYDFWPNARDIQGLVNENIEPAVYIARQAGEPRAVLPPLPPIVVTPEADADGDFTVVWSPNPEPGFDPAVRYDLMELTGFQTGIDDLESGTNAWITKGGYALQSSRYHSATHAFYSGRADRLLSSLTVAQSYSVQADDELTFWTWYDIEADWDYAYVQASSDAGLSWTNLPGNITTNSNPNGANQGNGITGRRTTWTLATFDLADFEGEDLILRFLYVTDTYVTGEGFYVDDVTPVARFESEVSLASATPATEFEVTGRSEGTYYYSATARDESDQASRSSTPAVVIVTGSPIEVTMTPVNSSLSPGDLLEIDAQVTNTGRQSQTVQLWTAATLPNGSSYPGNPVIGPTRVTLNAGQSISVPILHRLPRAIPEGFYTYAGAAGTYPDRESADMFQFRVTATTVSPENASQRR